MSITSTTSRVPHFPVYLKDRKIHKCVTINWNYGMNMIATNNAHQVTYHIAYACVSLERPKPGLLVRIETKVTRPTTKMTDISPTMYEHSWDCSRFWELDKMSWTCLNNLVSTRYVTVEGGLWSLSRVMIKSVGQSKSGKCISVPVDVVCLVFSGLDDFWKCWIVDFLWNLHILVPGNWLNGTEMY